jgi:nitrogen fixation protein NifB
VRERFPELLLCVSSNGLNLEPHIDELADLGVGHLTLTINAVDPEIGAKVYAWARYRKQVFRGLSAAQLLLGCQLAALEAAVDAGMMVKVNTILIPGVNEEHVGEVARVVAGLGAHTMNCMPMYPVVGTPFADYGSPSRAVVSAACAAAGEHVSQMAHCARCRADAVGMLGEAHTPETVDRLEEAAQWAPRSGSEFRSVAVATLEGLLVSEHLGRAHHLAVYSQNHEGVFELLAVRETPPAGTGMERWHRMAEILADCSVVLTAAAGEAPKEALATHGIQVVEWTGLISDALETLARGDRLHTFGSGLRCGAGCGGGEGC